MRPVIAANPGHDRAAWLHNADDHIIACRAQGHAWPKLKPGRPARGLKISRQHHGVYQLEFTCRDCGTIRVLTTAPSGDLADSTYYYIYPDRYQAPRGADIRRRDCLTEAWHRTGITSQAATA